MTPKPPYVDTEAQAATAKAISEDGVYAALEGDDNAIDVSNPGYVGVDAEYQNSAFDTNAPVGTPTGLAKAVKDSGDEKALAVEDTTRGGFSKGAPHPSELADQRLQSEAAAAARKQVAQEQAVAAARADLGVEEVAPAGVTSDPALVDATEALVDATQALTEATAAAAVPVVDVAEAPQPTPAPEPTPPPTVPTAPDSPSSE